VAAKEIDLTIIPVILSGGGGTRLWPMSRPENPKQFLTLTGDHSMFEQTVMRCADRSKFSPPIVVCGLQHETIVERQLSKLQISGAQLVIEPAARNTAPAIALAALAAPDENDLLLVMPSDHVITDVPAFHRAIEIAASIAKQDWLVTFGISASAPETGYGYIEQGQPIADGAYAVKHFVEKPERNRAEAMLAVGGHHWNGGIFLFSAKAYLDALASFAPAILASARNAMQLATSLKNSIHPDAVAFSNCPSDSIDYAVMEKAAETPDGRVAVVPVNMGWSDVGSWDALYDIGPGGSGASDTSNILEIDGERNLIRSDGIKLHLAGVEDLIVVASGNDVLIVPRGKSQQVKKIVETLKDRDAK
jgi:mannose-1-phosphate guanylyltransferase